MKRILSLGAVLLLAQPAFAATYTNEVLVQTTATLVTTTLLGRRAVEIQNLGPNAIFCAVHDSSAAVVNKARRIDPFTAFAVDLPPGRTVYCIAASANQSTGAATIVTEVD